jgi:hypothetical protein
MKHYPEMHERVQERKSFSISDPYTHGVVHKVQEKSSGE